MKKHASTILSTLAIVLSTIAIFGHHSLKTWWEDFIGPYQRKPYKNGASLHAEFPIVEQKPIVVVITSYNNSDVCERNLSSVFDQTYKNYRIIYIDDCSTDDTYEKVSSFIKEHKEEGRITLIRNTKKGIKAANFYKAVYSCLDHEIIACLDGDDWLAHERVLEKINRFYQNPDVWLTYGSAVSHPDYRQITGKRLKDSVFKKQKVRSLEKFDISMLRTFYAGLFKQIHVKDLMYKGQFLPSSDDMGFIYPLIEMASTHILFVPEILYIINDQNPIREYRAVRELQKVLPPYIKSLPKYPALKHTFDPKQASLYFDQSRPPICIFSEDNPLFLKATLDSLLKNLSFYNELFVIYHTKDPSFLKAYKALEETLSSIHFYNRDTFDLKQFLKEMNGSYVAFLNDELLLREKLDLSSLIKHLTLTHSHLFFVKFDDHFPQGYSLTEDINLSSLEEIQKVPHLGEHSFFILIHKDLCQKIFPLDSSLLSSLWTKEILPMTALFFDKSKCSDFAPFDSPFSFNKQDRLKQFEKGNRIDLTSLLSHPDQGVREGDLHPINVKMF